MHPTIQKIVEDRNQQDGKQEEYAYQSRRDASERDRLFTMLALSIDHLVEEIQNSTLKTEVVNHPQVQPIAGSVQIDQAQGLEEALDRLLEATTGNKLELPETQAITGSVEVSNFPTPEKVVIPEYPKQIKTDIVSLPKYVGEKLDDLKKAVLGLPAPIVNVPVQPTPQVHVDLQSVVDELEIVTQLLGTLAAYEAEETPLDLSPLISSMQDVEESIKAIKFPIPNFQSSWQHSRYMQSLDANTSYTYNAYGEVDTINVVLGDGTYTQTLTNATVSTPSAIDGLATHRVVTAKTNWVKTG